MKDQEKIENARKEMAIFRQEVGNRIAPVVDEKFNTERFGQMTVMALQSNPKLNECDRPSLFMELVKCARMGLVPDGNEAAIVPYRKTPKLLPMVWGLHKLVKQSGEINSLLADLVYENDVFKYGRNQHGTIFEHIPEILGNRGELVGAYAVAYMKEGPLEVEFMNEGDLAKVRSMAGDNSAWAGIWKSEMQKKAVLKRLMKRLPKTTHMDEFIRADNQHYVIRDAEPARPRSLKERVMSQALLSEDANKGEDREGGGEEENNHPA